MVQSMTAILVPLIHEGISVRQREVDEYKPFTTEHRQRFRVSVTPFPKFWKMHGHAFEKANNEKNSYS